MVENENPMADNELAGILRRLDLVKPHLRFKIFNAGWNGEKRFESIKIAEAFSSAEKEIWGKKERAFGSREDEEVSENRTASKGNSKKLKLFCELT